MNILSFCRDLDYIRSIDFEVVHASESDIAHINLGERLFHAILVDNCETLKLLKALHTGHTRSMTPVILLLKRDSTHKDIRRGIDAGATDFCVEPFEDLKEIIAGNFYRIDEILESAGRKLNRLRKSLVSSIPHEFYTPLTSIIGLASVMAKESLPNPEKHQEYSLNILKSACRLQKLIDDFTFYSQLLLKLSSNCEICFARSYFIYNPDEIIKMAVQELEFHFKKEIKFAVSSGVVHCNESNFYKLIYCLLENALKFSMDESCVMIGAYNLEHEYHIVVYNEGSGFDPEQIKLLGAFTQFDREIYEQQGMGMGIAIVMSLVELYEGRIKIFSEKNKYTKVEVFLKN